MAVNFIGRIELLNAYKQSAKPCSILGGVEFEYTAQEDLEDKVLYVMAMEFKGKLSGDEAYWALRKLGKSEEWLAKMIDASMTATMKVLEAGHKPVSAFVDRTIRMAIVDYLAKKAGKEAFPFSIKWMEGIGRFNAKEKVKFFYNEDHSIWQFEHVVSK
jgi:hypothetical protein